MAEELEDMLDAQIGEGKAGDPPAGGLREEAEEEPEGVAIAPHGGGPQALARREPVEEEGLHERADRGRRHGASSARAGAAICSNRRCASSSRAGVMVR
jgi:hypothetical protein